MLKDQKKKGRDCSTLVRPVLYWQGRVNANDRPKCEIHRELAERAGKDYGEIISFTESKPQWRRN